jgi:hypothetical protein
VGSESTFEIFEGAGVDFGRAQLLDALMHLMQRLNEIDSGKYNPAGWKDLDLPSRTFEPELHPDAEPLFVDTATGELSDIWVHWYTATNKCSIARAVYVGVERMENLVISINNSLNVLKEPE